MRFPRVLTVGLKIILSVPYFSSFQCLFHVLHGLGESVEILLKLNRHRLAQYEIKTRRKKEERKKKRAIEAKGIERN